MAQFIERLKSIDRRIVAVVGAIPILMCLCCCGILFLTPTDTEPTAAVALSTGEPAETQEPTNTAEPTGTAVPTEAPTETPKPTDTARPSNTPRPTNPTIPSQTTSNAPNPIDTLRPTSTPRPTSTSRPTNTPQLSNTSTPTEPPPDFIPPPPGDLATVTSITDGDTIRVGLNGVNYRVRYIGMDTPEFGEAFYTESSDANRALVEGQQVILVKDVSETDQFGRLLRYVYLQNGTFVNAELVRQGYAVVATFPPDVRHQELFLQLQEEARNAGRGLWAQPTPTSPPPTAIPAPTNAPTPTSPPTPLPTSPPTPQPTSPPQPTAPPPTNCDPSYPTVCIPPPPPDLDCPEIPYDDFVVLPPDPHGFDGDNDGIGCET